jgi:hypothetical protein
MACIPKNLILRLHQKPPGLDIWRNKIKVRPKVFMGNQAKSHLPACASMYRAYYETSGAEAVPTLLGRYAEVGASERYLPTLLAGVRIESAIITCPIVQIIEEKTWIRRQL